MIKIFCSNNATMKVGSHGFSGQMLLLALNGFFPTKDEYSGVQDSATNCYDFSKFKGQHDTAAPVTVEKEMFDKDGLDFIAVAFTAFKIAYLQGNCVFLYFKCYISVQLPYNMISSFSHS